jgi:hypothetical protein
MQTSPQSSYCSMTSGYDPESVARVRDPHFATEQPQNGPSLDPPDSTQSSTFSHSRNTMLLPLHQTSPEPAIASALGNKSCSPCDRTGSLAESTTHNSMPHVSGVMYLSMQFVFNPCLVMSRTVGTPRNMGLVVHCQLAPNHQEASTWM